MSWLKKLFSLCDHKWYIAQTIAVYETWDGEKYPGQNPAFHKYVQKCEKCGKLNVVKV